MASSHSESSDEEIIPSPTPSPPRIELKSRRTGAGKTISVEGNIGCGKTTFLKTFQKYKNVEILAEPVDKWKNCVGYNALDLMYKDAARWGCAFETLVTMSMLDHHNKTGKPSSIKMMERSVYSVKHCFVEQLRQTGVMPDMDYKILTECHDWVHKKDNIEIDLIVYLRAEPEICAQRMKRRNRSEEAGVPIEYLKSLHQLHDDWLIHGKRGKLPAPVLVINANQNMDDLQKDIDSLTHDILGGLSSQD